MGISQCDYHYAVQTGASIDWHCVTCLSMALSESTPVAESMAVDFSKSMSTLYEPLANPAESTPVAEIMPVDFTDFISTIHEPLVDPAAATTSTCRE